MTTHPASDTLDADVLVIGGGPVGLATAIQARLAGLDTIIIEPRTGAIDKACGEGLMPGALATLQHLGVDPRGADMRGIAYTDGTRYAYADFSGGLGRGVRRTELHRRLTDRATACGVTHLGDSMRSLAQDNQHVTLTLAHSERTLCARYAVGADGLHSRTRREIQLAQPATTSHTRADHRFGYRQHFAIPPWTDRVEVHWGPSAEVYVTPVDDAMIGVAILTSVKGTFAEHLARFPHLLRRIDGAQAASDVRAAGPLRQRAIARARGRVLLVGDAGGYVDALTGEGMAVGFAQGGAAVAAIASGHPQRYPRWAHAVSWRSTLLTTALLSATHSVRARRLIVPLAAGAPWVFERAVSELAATGGRARVSRGNP